MTLFLPDIQSDVRESVHRYPEASILRLVVSIPNSEKDMLPARSKANRPAPPRTRQKCTKQHKETLGDCEGTDGDIDDASED